ncbi:MAG: ABC transporter ATP-binding protein [Acidobacteria bacterium]|nr:ABC transporter ATP-binding protein [Acidobacteriota bacterium]
MPLLEVDRVSKRFGGLRAVSGASFSIGEKEIVFLVGPNGAGKTTLFNLITGFIHPDEGRIRFAGTDVTLITPNRAARLGIGRTFQIVKPLGSLTVLENVMLGAFLHTASRARAAHDAREVLAYLRMEAVAAATARDLPLAMLKRLEIARALATRPKLILLDEVVSGLSTAEAMALAALLQKLPERGVAAVGGVEHVMRVVVSIANRVVVLDHGAQIAEGEPHDVVRMPAVVEAYLGAKFRERHL